MYPVLRFAGELLSHRRSPPLGPFETHVSTHRCWPWDLDPWGELNNGRTLTLFDLGRTVLAQRTGLAATLSREGWSVTIAGASTRYRRRVTAMQRLQMRSRMLGWDDRFFYLEQSFWRRGECTTHMLMRAAAVEAGRMVPIERLTRAMGLQDVDQALPDWVQAWADAERARPWPPTTPEPGMAIQTGARAHG